MIRPNLLPATLLVSLAACAATHAPVDDSRGLGVRSDPQDAQPPIQVPFRPSEGQIGVAWIPWAVVDAHQRTSVPSAPPPDLDTGRGWAVRAGRYEDNLGFEMVFAWTDFEERRSDADLTTMAAYVDLTDRSELWRGPMSAWAAVGAGFGVVRFDWDHLFDDETTGLWQGEGVFALQFGRNVTIEARATGFLAGHPTRTVGLGATGMLGGSIVF